MTNLLLIYHQFRLIALEFIYLFFSVILAIFKNKELFVIMNSIAFLKFSLVGFYNKLQLIKDYIINNNELKFKVKIKEMIV